jgi:hypothetical protein
MMKHHMRKQFIKHFEQNLDAWQQGKITASERRILYTHWAAEAWVYMKSRQDVITEAFQRCGMLNAIDGSEDNLIAIQGIDGPYVVDEKMTEGPLRAPTVAEASAAAANAASVAAAEASEAAFRAQPRPDNASGARVHDFILNTMYG